MRKIKLETEKYYHVYNRGANKEEIFHDENDYFRFLKSMGEFNNDLSCNQRDYIARKIAEEKRKEKRPAEKKRPSLLYKRLGCFDRFGRFNRFSTELLEYFSRLPKLVEIICYCLLFNHYHFILKQLTDNGTKIFLHKLGTGYVSYFNNKYSHSGVLFQWPFKAYPINNENKLAWLSAYVNCNYEIHKLGKVENWRFSSYKDYLGLRQGKLINKSIILELFNNDTEDYKKYCQQVIKEAQDEKRAIKILIEQS
ncbi:MAG: hypothetical protein ABIJ91_02600 [Candidatus Kuenenbacteria bacterium]